MLRENRQTIKLRLSGEIKMWGSGRMVATIAFLIALGSTARAADCSANVSACIDANKTKPNAAAKCQAAGQRCAKTGIYVGPFSGVSYEVHKCLRWGCD
jgi:hypothetical protein